MGTDGPAGPRARTRGRAAVAIAFGLLSLNALVQAVLVPFGRSDDPPELTLLQLLIGAAGAAAAWGSWTGARWAPCAAILYGVATAGMLLVLGPLLNLETEARHGLWSGALIVLLLAAGAAWYLRRTGGGPS